MKNVKIKPIETTIIFVVFRLLLDIIMAIIKNKFTYYFGNMHLNLIRFTISTIIIIFFSKFIVKNINNYNITNSFIFVLFVLYYIPSWVIFTWLDKVPNIYALLILIHSLLLIIFNKIIPTLHFDINYNNYNDKLKLTINVIVWILLLFSFIITGYYNGFNIHLNLNDVYNLRAIFANLNLPLIVRYFHSIVSAIIPFFILYYLDKKNYVMSAICTLSQLLLFSFGGNKTFFFYILFAFFIYFMMKKKSNIGWFTKVINLIPCIGLLEYLINKTFFIISYLIRRVMLVPAYLSTIYFDFFTKNPFDYWQQSFLRWFGFQSSYEKAIPYIISEEYFNKPLMSSNNGMIGDAFANFGWIGVFIFPLLLIVIFKILDACAKGLEPRITFILAIIYGMNFINGSLWTRILSGGFIFMCLILLIVPRANKEKEGKIFENKQTDS